MKKIIEYAAAIALNIAALSYIGFLHAPTWIQAVIAFWVLTISFMVIVPIYEAMQRNLERHPILSKLAYPFIAVFGIIDVTVNVNYSLVFLLGHPAGKLGEDLTFTSHCKAIRVYTRDKMAKKQYLTKFELARYWLCENIYGKIMNAIQKGHYSDKL